MPDETAPTGLTAAEAATRLGVKRQTLYAYVSRGILRREVDPDGRTSRFDPAEVERLRLGRRPETDGELHTMIATNLTRVDDSGLLVRGHDLVGLVADGRDFTEVVDLLWDSPAGETWPIAPSAERTAARARAVGTVSASLIDDLRILVSEASLSDPLRHDLSPKNVRTVGRSLIWALATGLPSRHDGVDATVADGLWRRLSPTAGSKSKRRSLDAALGLLADHGLAASTFAARISASVRADPYSVVATGMGALGGRLHGAASVWVHEVLVETERSGDAVAAAGEAHRRMGVHPGFGHTVYTAQDPRYGALMEQIVAAWAKDPRLANVQRIRDVVGERSDAIPNIDLALGALTYLASMPKDAGEVIFAISRTAGWLAHAMEEYDEKPLRFRPRARYIGSSSIPPSHQ